MIVICLLRIVKKQRQYIVIPAIIAILLFSVSSVFYQKEYGYEYLIFYNSTCYGYIDKLGILTFYSDLFYDLNFVPFLIGYNYYILALFYLSLTILKITQQMFCNVFTCELYQY